MGPGEDLFIKLVTVGPGDELYLWWGHTALIVENHRTGESRFYDYGLFSFHRENFFLNFAMGRLIYSVGVSRAESNLKRIAREDRDIRIHTLNFLPKTRTEIAEFLEGNVRPENRDYLYDHYYDNCATRIRDILNTATDGQFKTAALVPGRMTLRQHIRRFTYHAFFRDWLLMFLQSGVIDITITEWDEMFLPSELEKQALAFSYRDDAGIMVPLVAETLIYSAAEDRPPVLDSPPKHWPITLIAGVVLGGLVVFLRLWAKQDCIGLQLLLSFFMGVLGSLLAFMSLFTDHGVTYWNENLFLANPLLLVIFGLLIARIVTKRKAGKNDSLWSSHRLAEGGWTILFGLGLLLIVLKLFPSFHQQNWLTLWALLPLYLSFSRIPRVMTKLFFPSRGNGTGRIAPKKSTPAA